MAAAQHAGVTSAAADKSCHLIAAEAQPNKKRGRQTGQADLCCSGLRRTRCRAPCPARLAGLSCRSPSSAGPARGCRAAAVTFRASAAPNRRQSTTTPAARRHDQLKRTCPPKRIKPAPSRGHAAAPAPGPRRRAASACPSSWPCRLPAIGCGDFSALSLRCSRHHLARTRPRDGRSRTGWPGRRHAAVGVRTGARWCLAGWVFLHGDVSGCPCVHDGVRCWTG